MGDDTDSLTGDQSREYDATLGALRHHQSLMHQSLAPFLGIGAALIGVALTGSFGVALRIAVCVIGLEVSCLWLFIAIRMRIYNFDYAARLKALESGAPGHFTKDETLRAKHRFLAHTPVIGDAVMFCAIGYLILFLLALLHVSGVLGGTL